MARYSHQGHDTIQYHTKYRDMIRCNTIRKRFTICKNHKQARNSAQHWSTVVLPINTVAAAGAWILAVWRGDGRRATGEATVGGRPVFLEVQGYWAGLLWRLHSYYCLVATRPAGMAQIFSDCAITKYLSRATTFTVNTWTHPGGWAITAN